MSTQIAQEKSRRWVFTFGFGHVHPVDGSPLHNCYAVIYGTNDQAREVMFRRFGPKWAMQYQSEDEAGVMRHGLTRIDLPEPQDQNYGTCSVCREDQIGKRHEHPCE